MQRWRSFLEKQSQCFSVLPNLLRSQCYRSINPPYLPGTPLSLSPLPPSPFSRQRHARADISCEAPDTRSSSCGRRGYSSSSGNASHWQPGRCCRPGRCQRRRSTEPASAQWDGVRREGGAAESSSHSGRRRGHRRTQGCEG